MGRHFGKNEEKITTGMIIAGILVIAILVTILIVYLLNSNATHENTDYMEEQEYVGDIEENDDTFEIVSSQIGKTIEDAQNETNTITQNTSKQNTSTNTVNNTTTSNNERKTQQNNKKNETTNTTVSEKKEETKQEIKFSSPIKGQILREYATDSLVYSDTLQEWITHNGIDIKADKTTVVTAAAKGKVFAIKNDPRYGLTVIINHDDGYQTIYANLLTAEYIVEGEDIDVGQTIGTVGNSATFEIADEYHLHFELLKDNQYLNPTNFMSFE